MSDQRVHIEPVAVSATFWYRESFSGGRLKSLIPAMTNAHFIVGAQKWTVFGPTSEFQNLENLLPARAPDMIKEEQDVDWKAELDLKLN